ncbi:MAG: hypothetical protein ABSG41_19280 [Bryobacteraceae bacterium]|jgi:hypothetical protein
MPPFRFRLAKALEWYGEQCRMEEDRLRDKIAALKHSQAELARASEARIHIERDLLQTAVLPAAELLALARYRRRAIQEEQGLTQERIRCEREMETQFVAVQAARRRVRLIGKIRERKLTEHTVEENRELEELAADAFRAVHFAP